MNPLTSNTATSEAFNIASAASQEFQRQIQLLTPAERQQLLSLLALAQQLDEQFADLHLAFPALEVVFYRWSSKQHARFAPGELLEAILNLPAAERTQRPAQPR